MPCQITPSPRPCVLDAVDVRLRLALCLTFCFVSACLLTLPAAALALLMAAAALLVVRPAGIAKKWLTVNLFMGFIWLFTPFSAPGTPYFGVGPWVVTDQAVLLCTLITLKGNAVFLGYCALTAQMSVSQTAAGLLGLHLPPKLVTLLLLTARQVQAFHQLWHRLNDAVRLRGFTPGFNTHTYRTYAALIAVLFSRAFIKSRIMNEALLLRGFTGNWPAVPLPPLTASEYLLLLAGLAVSLIPLFVDQYFPVAANGFACLF